MNHDKTLPIILIAEDDKDDRILMREAFVENGFNNQLIFVKDGEEFMEYLKSPNLGTPDLIFLDLNLPRKDGREVLQELKTNDDFKAIPVIIFSTSNSYVDISQCYQLGANSYLTKPQTFKELVNLVRGIGQFWFDLVEYTRKVEL